MDSPDACDAASVESRADPHPAAMMAAPVTRSDFDRAAARGMRLDIASGTAVRFEPGQTRDVALVPVGGKRVIYGFNQKVMGAL